MNMANKAIHQLQEATELQDGDVLIVARPSGGSFVDRKIDAATFPQRTLYASVTVPSASVLTLGTTPFELLPAQGAGTTIQVLQMAITTSGQTTPYDTENVLVGTQLEFDASLIFVDGAYICAEAVPQATLPAPNQPLNLTAASDLTSGDGDLVIQVWYRIINI